LFVSYSYSKMSSSVIESIELTSRSLSASETPAPLEATPSEATAIPTRLSVQRIDSRLCYLLNHIPNIRRNSPLSAIWKHGAEYLDNSDPQGKRWWVCDLCNRAFSYKKLGITSNFSRHLWNQYGIGADWKQEEEPRSRKRLFEDESEVSALVTKVNIDYFRKLLV